MVTPTSVDVTKDTRGYLWYAGNKSQAHVLAASHVLSNNTVIGHGLPLNPYTPFSTRMNPENTHKLMGFYMEVLILGIIL